MSVDVFKNIKPLEISNIPATEVKEKWSEFKRTFMYAKKLLSRSEERRIIDFLFHVGGSDLQKVHESICGGEEVEYIDQIEAFPEVIQKLDDYFLPKQHATFERHQFWNLKPGPEESLDKFLLRANMHASKCDFGNTEEKSREVAVIDKIIMLAPPDLRRKILEKPMLNVSSLTQILNTHYSIQQQVKELNTSSNHGNSFNTSRLEASASVNKVSNVHKTFAKPARRSYSYSGTKNDKEKEECGRCGYTNHTTNDRSCPALEEFCGKCGKKGHFKRKCRSTESNKRKHEATTNDRSRRSPNKRSRVAAVESESDDENPERLSIRAIGDNHDELLWVNIGGVLVEMLIDSGSYFNILNTSTWNKLKIAKANIYDQGESNKQLKAYAQKDKLKVLCVFKAKLSVEGQTPKTFTEEVFYVIEGGSQNLLGRNTAKKVGVLKLGLFAVDESSNDVNDSEAFPKIKIPPIKIEIDPSVIPKQQHLRRVPISLKDYLEAELTRLQKVDVIERVRKPSKFVSPLIFVPKDRDQYRICVDMRQANLAIKRELHLIPTMDDFLSELSNAKIFSRLDIKDAYHQIELDEESREVTTFITHLGMFR